MPLAGSSPAQTAPVSTVWQTRLQNQCKTLGIRPPAYQEFSDRRGGRTAWSSTVEVNGNKHQARYWYDGTWINNAREDAAEVALQRMGVISTPRSPHVQFYGALTV